MAPSASMRTPRTTRAGPVLHRVSRISAEAQSPAEERPQRGRLRPRALYEESQVPPCRFVPTGSHRAGPPPPGRPRVARSRRPGVPKTPGTRGTSAGLGKGLGPTRGPTRGLRVDRLDARLPRPRCGLVRTTTSRAIVAARLCPRRPVVALEVRLERPVLPASRPGRSTRARPRRGRRGPPGGP